MIGGVATPIGLDEVDTGTLQDARAGQYMLLFGITAHRDDVRVLHEDQAVATLATLPLFDELLLEAKRFAPIEASEIQHFTFPHTVRCLGVH